MAEIELDGNGHYWRAGHGPWRYALGGERVPGARPKTRWDVEANLPSVQIGRLRYYAILECELPRASAQLQELARHEACLQETAQINGRRVRTRLIPAPICPKPGEGERVPGMWAPELEADQLLDARQVAQLMGYSDPLSVATGMIRGRVPQPVIRERHRWGPSLFWSRPTVELWRAGWREYLHELPAQQRMPQRRGGGQWVRP